MRVRRPFIYYALPTPLHHRNGLVLRRNAIEPKAHYRPLLPSCPYFSFFPPQTERVTGNPIPSRQREFFLFSYFPKHRWDEPPINVRTATSANMMYCWLYSIQLPTLLIYPDSRHRKNTSAKVLLFWIYECVFFPPSDVVLI